MKQTLMSSWKLILGPDLWRLNTSPLNVLSFRQKIERVWTRWRKRKSHFPNLATWWDTGKRHLCLIAMKHQSRSFKSANSHSQSLYNRLRNAINGAKNRTMTPLNRQIANLNRLKIHSYFLGKKIEWKELGEKCNAHFFEHHWNTREHDVVHQIQTANGYYTPRKHRKSLKNSPHFTMNSTRRLHWRKTLKLPSLTS